VKNYRIFSNVMDGKEFWQVGYIVNPEEPLHSGNVWQDEEIHWSLESAEAALEKFKRSERE
jgi:hypothetical protein